MTSKDADAKILDEATAALRDARGKEAAEILEHPAVRKKILAIAAEADKRQRNRVAGKVAAIVASAEVMEIERLKEELADARAEIAELKAEIARHRAAGTRVATSF